MENIFPTFNYPQKNIQIQCKNYALRYELYIPKKMYK